MKKETIGDRIRYLRRSFEMSQTEFASKIGVSLPTVTRYEKNKGNPKIDTITKIIEVTGCRSEWLMTGNGDMEIKVLVKKAIDTIKSKTIKAINTMKGETVKAIDIMLSETDLNSIRATVFHLRLDELATKNERFNAWLSENEWSLPMGDAFDEFFAWLNLLPPDEREQIDNDIISVYDEFKVKAEGFRDILNNTDTKNT